MQRVLSLVDRFAPKHVNVLVSGETGTGKELIATSLHALSGRASGPLVRVNCGAIPRDLLEAELFGHTRGAFSGAVRSRPGFFGAADGGTLVLDEVEALPMEAQATLLRAVHQGEVQTVGSEMARLVDVRVVACTNVDLATESEAGRFRGDLYFRLAVVTITLPPLRTRPEDIEPLVRHFVDVYARRFGLGSVVIQAPVLHALQAMRWRGNVRELENAIATMVALSEDGQLRPDDLASDDRPQLPPPVGAGFRERVAGFERSLLCDALARSGNNQARAARSLGLSRTTFLGMLRRHEIDAGSQRAEEEISWK